MAQYSPNNCNAYVRAYVLPNDKKPERMLRFFGWSIHWLKRTDGIPYNLSTLDQLTKLIYVKGQFALRLKITH
ncbi:hypothetical protein PaelaDRAFT_4720 [Paenibacillus lactis 154]|uniref:Uncharacterized protein n=1 Tax=Paenibacillus lactis 154 TaxID=743719 RepID=G4HL59_9BACL|nr:hypothetical protein PaelaDRAFT_4720 [Paenibacillus lactis 154]